MCARRFENAIVPVSLDCTGEPPTIAPTRTVNRALPVAIVFALAVARSGPGPACGFDEPPHAASSSTSTSKNDVFRTAARLQMNRHGPVRPRALLRLQH